MTIKQHGGIFSRNPSFNDVSVETLSIAGTALSSTAAELNILDGVTADATELNYLDSASTSAVVASKAVLANSSGNIAFPDGKGIDFSATGDGLGTASGELFADYEEGTWTPVVADAPTGGNTGTIGVIESSYTKVGRLVTIFASMTNINTSGMTAGNVLYIRGLPYASSSTNGVGDAIGLCRVDGIDFSGFITSQLANGNAYFEFIDNVDSANDTQITVSDVQSSSSDIAVAMTYGV